jgi:xanthine dehydrogenase accessory factor
MGTIGGGELEERVSKDGIDILKTGINSAKTYSLSEGCGGTVTVFFEFFSRQKELVIFGAGNVGKALAHAMSGTSFAVIVIDERAELTREGIFPEGVRVIRGDYREEAGRLDTDNLTSHIVITTYSHETDEAILRIMITKPHRYLGVIGSSRKCLHLRSRMEEWGIGKEVRERVSCPVGDQSIKGKLPAEIAISIASEVLRWDA